MSIIRDDFDERQIRIDGMIEEFRKAQSRRRLAETAIASGDDHQADLEGNASDRVAAVRATPAPQHSDG